MLTQRTVRDCNAEVTVGSLAGRDQRRRPGLGPRMPDLRILARLSPGRSAGATAIVAIVPIMQV